MIIKMVAREIGKDTQIKITVIHPLQIHRMRGHLGHNMGNAVISHVAHDFLHFIRFGRCVGRRTDFIMVTIVNGSENAAWETRFFQDGFQKIRDRCLSVSAHDRN